MSLSLNNGAIAVKNSSLFAQYTGARTELASFKAYKLLLAGLAALGAMARRRQS